MGMREWAMLIALSVLWGGSFFFVGVAVRELPPFTIVLVRVGVAAGALWILLAAMGQRVPRLWAAFLGMGLLNNAIPFALIVWGQGHIASGLASILNATTPLFTVLVAHVCTRDERLTPGKVAGVLLGLAGVIVMLGGDVLGRPVLGGPVLGELGIDLLAQAACLAAALSYGFAGIFGRRFRRLGVTPLATATGQLSASTLVLLPLALLVDHPWALPMPGLPTLGAMLGLGLLSTALAYILFFRILATAGATNLALVTFLIPVSAILLGVLVLGEVLLLRHVLGMVLIGAGLVAINGRVLRRGP